MPPAAAAVIDAYWAAAEEEVMTGLCFFDLDSEGRIARLADFRPGPYDPPPGREHLVQRW